jgi:hypothetical protein
MSETRTERGPIKVLISYSHDSPEHAERVRGLSASLSRDGCECRVDVYKDTDEDWPTWMTRQLIEADFVLCVVTETYTRRFRDKELPDQGLGVGWEAGLIRRLLYQQKLHNNRIFPVLFDEADRQHIPLELQGYDFFLLNGKPGYEALLRKVLNRPLYAEPDSGPPPDLETRATAPLFSRPGSALSGHTEPPGGRSPRIRWTDDLRIYGDKGLFAGRRAELALLDRTLRKGRTRVLSLWAEGGAGKTRLLFQWLNGLRDHGWRGIEAVFVHSFYSQGSRDGGSASSETFLNDALAFFGYAGDPIKDFRQKGSTLAQLVATARGMVVLDGLEPLQYPTHNARAGEFKDEAISAFLLTLANLPGGLCLVSTRQESPELKSRRGVAVTQQPLDRLNADDGIALLRELEVKGPEKELRAAVEDYHGHAYSVMLLGTYLRAATPDHEIRRRYDSPLVDKEGEHDHHIEHMLQMYEKHLGADSPDLAALRLLGFFDRPATRALIDVLRAPKRVVRELGEDAKKKPKSRQMMTRSKAHRDDAPDGRSQPQTESDSLPVVTQPLLGLSDDQWQRVLTRLSGLRLLSTAADGSLDSHPLLREYFGGQLRREQPEAWRAGHRRLYEHLCATTKEGDQPTLEDLQPLYQAVAHGCQAGLQQEACDKVYRDRILRGKEAYSTKKLGAFGSDLGAVACFFETPWSRVSPVLIEPAQAWLLNQAAFRLRALGRLTEALEPMRAGLPIEVKREDWRNAAISASNLSELELTLGLIEPTVARGMKVAGAVGDAEQSVTYADRSGNEFDMMDHRTVHADVLHQAGRRPEAQVRFREAEQMQAKSQPGYPLMYSMAGFRYCDLLLTEAERAAWQLLVNPKSEIRNPKLVESCLAVSERAAQTLKWAERHLGLLDVALDHLTLGRAALYQTIIERSEIRNPKSEIEEAVSGLRRAGDTTRLPLGLLTRAWLRFLEDDAEGAQVDLNEAWEIAERGPMELHLADIHLYRARLFHAVTPYPWDKDEQGKPRGPKDDLAAARKLIEQCGYHRRDEELADAEEAAKSW